MIAEKIPEHFFAPEEVRALRDLPEEGQVEAFFNCWTRKEAFIKAHGNGLALPLNEFVVNCDFPAKLVSTAFDPVAVTQWKLYSLQPGEGYAAAVAVEGDERQLRLFRWSSEVMTPAPQPQPHTNSYGSS